MRFSFLLNRQRAFSSCRALLRSFHSLRCPVLLALLCKAKRASYSHSLLFCKTGNVLFSQATSDEKNYSKDNSLIQNKEEFFRLTPSLSSFASLSHFTLQAALYFHIYSIAPCVKCAVSSPWRATPWISKL